MQLIGKYEFNNCLDFNDIESHLDEVNKMINEIKNKFKN